MKKTLLNFVFIICIGGISYAQPFAPIQNIDPNTGFEPYEIASGDLDGDGDIDIVMATYDYNDGVPLQDYIKWYKNDGIGNFTIETTVSSTIRWVDGLIVANIDGQFGLDIIATSAIQNQVVYFLSDGSGGFGSEVVIDGALNGPGEVVAGDINNDGNIDIATMSYDNNRTVWYSGDGTGNFILEADIENGSTKGAYYIDTADMDGDGDLDMLIGFYNTQSIEIYYNQYIESGTMTVSWIKDTVSVSTGNSAILKVGFADVNNDGIMDVFKVDNVSGNVAWYNKTKNGLSVETIISDQTIIDRPGTAYVVDLDNDTFNDVIVTDGGTIDDAIIYFKGANNASPSTTPTFIADNNFQMFDITVADFDGDLDNDIASIGNQSDTVFWIENNLIILQTPEFNLSGMSIYPNPTQDQLNFKGSFTENLHILITDMLGKQILTASISEGQSIDVSKFDNGLYILKFQGINSTFKFIKQ
ncbi:MAG: T9SS type A sorting domain-containing protein [Aquaticitalea sp.]